MAKRTATSDLNHDNWDRDEEPEQAGTFAKASEDALKRRVIKVAKRRNPIASVHSEEGKPAAFEGFSGFSKTASSPSSNTFGFLSNLAGKTEQIKANGTADDNKQDEYYAKLKGLNESVTEWIKKHVNSNPFINLQPIFKDYDKYFDELEKMKTDTALEKTPQTSLTNSSPKFSFGTNSTSTGFSFGTSSATTVTLSSGSTITPTFSFSSTSSEGNKFSFTSTVVKQANDQEEPEDEPPKVEFTPIVEEGYIYTVRCKVFVKKDGSFADHGVGSLYLKPVPDSEKVQLIVRADTNLGRLICNFILSESIPMQRMGKKDLMLVCIPTPEMQPPPVPILLRVKTPEDADELLNTLQKHKK